MLAMVGYLSTMSAAPGDTVDVMVGSYGADRYRADLRRIIQGDENPAGPGYKDEAVAIDLGSDRKARKQAVRPGSYVRIADRGILSDLRSFTAAAVIWSTRPGAGEQGILCMAGDDGPTLALMLDSRGHLQVRLKLADGKMTTLSSSAPLAARVWSLVAASFDSTTGKLQLSWATLQPNGILNTLRRSEGSIEAGWRGRDTTRALIAALPDGNGHAAHSFDGKIDNPVIFDRAIDATLLAGLLSDPIRIPGHPALVAQWDFSRGIDGTAIYDASPHHLDGETINCPARAMTGWRWQGQSLKWNDRPDLYTAIHFHSDDIYDFGWDADFSFKVPNDLKSGIYAVRLMPDGRVADAYYCVFAVRPPRDRATGNTVAFLMPTASYLAYANHRLGFDVPGTETGMGRLVEMDRHHAFLQEHPEFGFSFYEVHADGSGVFYSSLRRPIVDFQPKVQGFLGGLGSNLWQFNADTHISGWLDHIGQSYDVITDEDLHKDGLGLLRRYRAVLTGTHPEYYSLPMLDALRGFVDRGGRLMYLGGNGFYWRISFSDKLPGVIECRRSEAGIRPWEPGPGQFHHAFTGEYGGLWRRNGRPPNALVGVGMTSQGFDISEPYVLRPESKDPRVAFMFDGIQGPRIGAFGLSGGGAAGLEVDRADPLLGTPSHALVVASSERHTDIYLMTPEDLLDPTPDWTGTQNDLIRADLTFLESTNGGAVFSTGSIAWAGAMAWNSYDNEISRLTRNVLRRFDDPTPFEAPQH